MERPVITPKEPWILQLTMRGRRWSLDAPEVVFRLPLPAKIVVTAHAEDGSTIDKRTLDTGELEWIREK